MRKKTKEEFIQDAIKVHGDKYDYRLVEYNGTHTKVKIICGCDNHGIFNQTPHSHISGAAGCPICYGTPKKNTEQFILDAKEVHGNRYDYSLVKYDGNKVVVDIVCHKHGVFKQIPSGHLRGDGCSECAIEESSLKSTFIDRVNKIHDFKYDYSLTEYVNNRTNVKIICKYHNETFELRPDAHLEGRGCPYCSGYKLHKIDFVIAANKVHNFKFDYRLVGYIDSETKIKIICPDNHTFEQYYDNHLRGDGCGICAGYHKTQESVITDFISLHGDKYDYSEFKYECNKIKGKIYCEKCDYHFYQNYSSHMRGDGCPKCIGRHKTNEDIINEFIGIHGDKYDYSLVNYTRSIDKVSIGCKKHNIIFEQTPSLHLCGQGCPDCGKEKVKIGKEEFIIRAVEVHGEKYDYSKVEYINSYTHVVIICPEHGVFEQTPKSHLNSKCGCPHCSESIGEREIRLFLDKHNIIYEREKMFDGCINKTFLKYDYYLNDLNFCVEFDGKQHYEPIEYFGGIDKLKETQLCDDIKNEYCKNNNIRLLRIRYDENVEEKLNEFLFSHDKE